MEKLTLEQNNTSQKETDKIAVIAMLADLRKRQQELSFMASNLKAPETNRDIDEIGIFENNRIQVNREASGEDIWSELMSTEFLEKQEGVLRSKATSFEKAAPNFSAYLLALIIKSKQGLGIDFSDDLEKARILSSAKNLPVFRPNDLLPNALLLGIQKRESLKLERPSLIEASEIAMVDDHFLKSYALALTESERVDFLRLIPENKRGKISNILDASVSGVLHQSLVSKDSSDFEQRRSVRLRLRDEVEKIIRNNKLDEKSQSKMLGKALGEMGEDSKQVILDMIRDDTGRIADVELVHVPRILKILLDNFEDYRVNDLALQLSAAPEISGHLTVYLASRLSKNGYIPKDVAKWYQEGGQKGESVEVYKKVVGLLGVIPSRQILEFVADDRRWLNGQNSLSLDERIEKIKKSKEKFENINTSLELIEILSSNEDDALIYFLINGGKDRFNLINNYSFDKFKEMLGLISQFKIHEGPMRDLEKTLINSGISSIEAKDILKRLRDGHFPLENARESLQTASFQASENSAVIGANRELASIMGKEQLGVNLAFPLYRKFLEEENGDQAKSFLQKVQKASSFTDRLALMQEIEEVYPDYKGMVKMKLASNWQKFGEKMIMEMPLDQVLGEQNVPVKGEEMLPKLDVKRIDLKRAKKELLILLRGENKAMGDTLREIAKKKKSISGLEKGVLAQADDIKRKELQDKIDEIKGDIIELEKQIEILKDARADERFSHLTEEEKRKEVENLSREIMALTEKSPSAIFTYLIMQVLGEENLRESDISLIKEMESHLQGAFQTISDHLNYNKPKGISKRAVVDLQYLDKTERLMTMVRFADSKICCFSSSNYEMIVGHSTPNKQWVASINKDPLSFVISMERPQDGEDGKSEVKDNIGFIFGNYGIDENGELAVMLNGIYYAPGIDSKAQVESILSAVERMFKGLPVKTVAIASKYGGGSVGDNLPKEYKNNAVEMTRLRALDDSSGDPENKIYDDLDTGEYLNRPHMYGGTVWHKKINQ